MKPAYSILMRLFEKESTRYTNMRGKKVWTDATWVGPKEMIVGHETYRVRLDL